MVVSNSYVVYFEPVSKGWVSICLETNVASQGETKQEAINMLKEALELYYDDITVETRTVENVDFGQLELTVS